MDKFASVEILPVRVANVWSTEYRVPSTEYRVPKPGTQYSELGIQNSQDCHCKHDIQFCKLSVVFGIKLQAWVPSAEYRVPSAEYWVPSARYRVPGTEYRVPKPGTRYSTQHLTLAKWYIIIYKLSLHRSSSSKCQVPKPEARSPRAENMYTTCPFFTHCTNHQVLSAETLNTKPGVQHVHFSFTLHKSLSSKCRGPRPKAWDPKICTQHVHFSLTAQITEFWVQKHKTRNPVCNMSIFHLHCTNNQVPSAECRNPKPGTQKYVHNIYIFHLLHK
jgi:hypothetical protein